MVEEVVLRVVDELDRADLTQPIPVRLQEAAHLLGRLVEEVATFELCLGGQLAERDEAGRAAARSTGHGLYTKSGPIRSRRKIVCFESKIDSATRWPKPRIDGSA